MIGPGVRVSARRRGGAPRTAAGPPGRWRAGTGPDLRRLCRRGAGEFESVTLAVCGGPEVDLDVRDSAWHWQAFKVPNS